MHGRFPQEYHSTTQLRLVGTNLVPTTRLDPAAAVQSLPPLQAESATSCDSNHPLAQHCLVVATHVGALAAAGIVYSHVSSSSS